MMVSKRARSSMATNTKRLLVIVVCLLGVQWILLPIFAWQNESASSIEADLAVVAARSAAIDSLPELEQFLRLRSARLDELSNSAFTPGPTTNLEIQRSITDSLANNRLKVVSFEWAPQTDGAISILRAQVRVTGQSRDVFEWVALQQFETTWIDILALKMRHADSRNLDSDWFTSDLSLEFVLSEANRD